MKYDVDEALEGGAFFEHATCGFVSNYAASYVSFRNKVWRKSLRLSVTGQLTFGLINHRAPRHLFRASPQVGSLLFARIPMDVWEKFVCTMLFYVRHDEINLSWNLLDAHGPMPPVNVLPLFHEPVDFGEFFLRFNDVEKYMIVGSWNYEGDRCFISVANNFVLTKAKACMLMSAYIERCRELKKRLDDVSERFQRQIDAYFANLAFSLDKQ